MDALFKSKESNTATKVNESEYGIFEKAATAIDLTKSRDLTMSEEDMFQEAQKDMRFKVEESGYDYDSLGISNLSANLVNTYKEYERKKSELSIKGDKEALDQLDYESMRRETIERYNDEIKALRANEERLKDLMTFDEIKEKSIQNTKDIQAKFERMTANSSAAGTNALSLLGGAVGSFSDPVQLLMNVAMPGAGGGVVKIVASELAENAAFEAGMFDKTKGWYEQLGEEYTVSDAAFNTVLGAGAGLGLRGVGKGLSKVKSMFIEKLAEKKGLKFTEKVELLQTAESVRIRENKIKSIPEDDHIAAISKVIEQSESNRPIDLSEFRNGKLEEDFEMSIKRQIAEERAEQAITNNYRIKIDRELKNLDKFNEEIKAIKGDTSDYKAKLDQEIKDMQSKLGSLKGKGARELEAKIKEKKADYMTAKDLDKRNAKANELEARKARLEEKIEKESFDYLETLKERKQQRIESYFETMKKSKGDLKEQIKEFDLPKAKEQEFLDMIEAQRIIQKERAKAETKQREALTKASKTYSKDEIDNAAIENPDRPINDGDFDDVNESIDFEGKNLTLKEAREQIAKKAKLSEALKACSL